MKCLCGHIEPESYWRETPIYFSSGKRKGELKNIQKDWIEPEEEDRFIRLGVEKDFSFIKHYKHWGYMDVNLFACPKCGTVKLGGIGDN